MSMEGDTVSDGNDFHERNIAEFRANHPPTRVLPPVSGEEPDVRQLDDGRFTGHLVMPSPSGHDGAGPSKGRRNLRVGQPMSRFDVDHGGAGVGDQKKVWNVSSRLRR